MIRRLFKRRGGISKSDEFWEQDIILFAAGIGNAVAILSLFIFYWFVCNWRLENPLPIVYKIDDAMVAVEAAAKEQGAPSGTAGKVNWLELPGISRGLKSFYYARELVGPIMVMFTGDNCSLCDRMERETLSNPAVCDRLNENWRCILININKGREVELSNSWLQSHRGLMRWYSIHKENNKLFATELLSHHSLMRWFNADSLPTFVFFDREGEPVQRVSGYWNADAFGSLLDYMRDGVYKWYLPFEQYLKEVKR
ncbi:MAG: thioredoxin family protein [Candidatus Latescibacter sp.]|nr:thioredoxin family protein [Candidatus Latescibacter sp.]